MANCCECVATKEYQGNRSQRDYTFEFEYYETSEIHVSVYNSDSMEWEGLDAWRLINPTTVRLDNPTEERIRIYRCTDLHPMRAVFQPGTAIKAKDLNNNFDQVRNAIEEAKCCASDALNEIDYGYNLWLNRIEVGSTDPRTGVEGDLVKSNSDLVINDNVVASTKWIDNRYWDQCDETTYSYDNWFDEMDDVHVPTVLAVEQRLVTLQALEGVKKVTGIMQREQKWDESVTNDDHVATTDAIVERLDHELSVSSDSGNTWLQPGKIWIKSDTAELFYRRAEGTQWIQLDTKGDQGEQGIQGPPGNNGADGLTPEFSIGVVTASPPGADAQVTQTGTTLQPVLNFVLPRGEEGPPGPPGTPGDGGGEILTFVEPLVKTGTTVSINLLTLPNTP